jgi:hypothetical protein
VTGKTQLQVTEENHYYSAISDNRNIEEPLSLSLSRSGRSAYGDPKTLGGVLTAINAAGVCSVNPTSRNAELYSFCEPPP